MFRQKPLITQKLLLIQNNSKHNCFHKAFFLFFPSDDYIILFLIFAKNENQFPDLFWFSLSLFKFIK